MTIVDKMGFERRFVYIPLRVQEKILGIIKDTPQCIEFEHCNYQGYAMFQAKKKGKRFHIRGNRASYQMFVGSLGEKGEYICHKCDNPRCINPKHLFRGTHQDNMNDMVAKGRSCKGIRNHFWIDGRSKKPKIKELYNPMKKGKLSEKKIFEILALIHEGYKLKEISKKSGVPIYTIKDISCGRIYKPLLQRAVSDSSTKKEVKC